MCSYVCVTHKCILPFIYRHNFSIFSVLWVICYPKQMRNAIYRRCAHPHVWIGVHRAPTRTRKHTSGISSGVGIIYGVFTWQTRSVYPTVILCDFSLAACVCLAAGSNIQYTVLYACPVTAASCSRIRWIHAWTCSNCDLINCLMCETLQLSLKREVH